MSTGIFIPSEGPKDAKIAIVGEAPGATEEANGRPFCGASGQLLNEMLANAGICRRDCYITNVVKTRPPNNDFNIFYRDSKRNLPNDVLLAAHTALHAELKVVRPNVIIALGNEALRALMGRKLSVENWRGSLLESPCGKVISTYHPAYILRAYEHRKIAELDLRRAASEQYTPSLNIPPVHTTLNPSLEQCLAYLNSEPDLVAFDIETFGQNIRCIGFCSEKGKAICIPFFKIRQTHIFSGAFECAWSEADEKLILDAMERFLANPRIRKIAQNFPFDATMLEREFGLEVRGLYMDTMVAFHCCYSELPKGLDFLCSIFTKYPYYSDYSVMVDSSLWFYNCMDCIATFEVCLALEEEMKDLNVDAFYHRHAQPLMMALSRAGNYGPKVDLLARDKMRTTLEAELVDIKTKLLGLVGFELNPNSSTQMMKYFYHQLALKPIINRKSGNPTLNEEALKTLAVKNERVAIPISLILDYREKTKLIGTFLDSKLNPEGRLPTSYNAAGTTTGRISSSKTIFGLGGNLQQIPRGEFRRIFVAPPGKVLIKTDLSQAEARAVAWYANIHFLIKAFQTPGFDIHRWNAAIVFNKTEADVTKKERQTSKALVHGANYGLGHITAARLAGVPTNVAKQALERYKETLKELGMWHQDIRARVMKDRRLYTPLGRMRMFFGRMDEETFRSAYAFLPQSLIADIINQAFFTLDKSLPAGCRLILQVHDELVIEADESLVPEVIALMRTAIEIPIRFENVDVPMIIPQEIKIGPNWFDTKEYTNAVDARGLPSNLS
jgi:uracil-DNA glycosylase family 4